MSRIIIITVPPPPPPPPGGRVANTLKPSEHLRLAAAQLDAEEEGRGGADHGYKVFRTERVHAGDE